MERGVSFKPKRIGRQAISIKPKNFETKQKKGAKDDITKITLAWMKDHPTEELTLEKVRDVVMDYARLFPGLEWINDHEAVVKLHEDIISKAATRIKKEEQLAYEREFGYRQKIAEEKTKRARKAMAPAEIAKLRADVIAVENILIKELIHIRTGGLGGLPLRSKIAILNHLDRVKNPLNDIRREIDSLHDDGITVPVDIIAGINELAETVYIEKREAVKLPDPIIIPPIPLIPPSRKEKYKKIGPIP